MVFAQLNGNAHLVEVELLQGAHGRRAEDPQHLSVFFHGDSDFLPKLLIHEICKDGDPVKLEEYLCSGPSYLADERDEHGETALHLCVRLGLPLLIKVLVRRGADLERPNFQGLTPLATLSPPVPSNLPMMAMLLKLNANPHALRSTLPARALAVTLGADFVSLWHQKRERWTARSKVASFWWGLDRDFKDGSKGISLADWRAGDVYEAAKDLAARAIAAVQR